MKRAYFVWIILFLLPANLKAASNDAILLEGEGQVLKSHEFSKLNDISQSKQSKYQIFMRIGSENFPKIVLHATILDVNGKPISDLTVDDFILAEQSSAETVPVKQSLACFEKNDANTKISLALVFDISGSMGINNRLMAAKTAAIRFFINLRNGDRASLVTFSGCDQGKIVIPSVDVKADNDQNGTPDIVDAVRSLYAIDRTALYDGIACGIDRIDQEAFPKGVIVFADGKSNNDCHFTINEVIQRAKNHGISVYTIGLGNDSDPHLPEIATETGGYFRAASTATDMEAIYSDISEVIRGQYTFCYTTFNPSMDGTLRTVTVNIEGKAGSRTYTAPPNPNPNNPTISHSPIVQWQKNNSISIKARVSDPDAGDSVFKVAFYYRILSSDPEAPYTSVSMTNTGRDLYSGTIPANMVTLTGVEYYLTAWDTQGGRTKNGSASSPHRIEITTVSHSPAKKARQADSKI